MVITTVTIIVFLACCLLMLLAVRLSGKALPGGCGNKPPGSPRCADCPRRAGENR